MRWESSPLDTGSQMWHYIAGLDGRARVPLLLLNIKLLTVETAKPEVVTEPCKDTLLCDNLQTAHL